MKMNKDINKNLGEGNVFSLLMKLSLPMILAQIINVLYNIVDRMYIGRIAGVGVDALTGVGVTLPIIVLISAFAALIGMGGAPIASIKMGEGKKEEAEHILSNAFTMLLVFGIALPAIFFIFKDKLLYMFGASEKTFQYANEYISIYSLGSIFVMFTLGLNSFINSQGFSKFAMITVIVGALTNIILDPILIFGFNMGVKGAAYATVISQAISALWALKFLLGKKTILKIRKEYLAPKLKILRPMILLGLSPFIMQSTESLLQITFNVNLGKFGGDIYIGIMTVLTSVMQMMFLPLQGFTQGAQPILGYNYGAKNIDRVKKTMKYLIATCLTFAVCSWILAQTMPKFLILIFNDDPTLVNEGVKCLKVFFSMQFIMGLQLPCQQIFISLGKAKTSIFFALLRKVFLLIPLILILPRIGLGVKGIFIAEPISDTISALSCFITFLIYYRKLDYDLS